VIAVPGNPLEDSSVTKSVKFVMKNGVVYKGREQGVGNREQGR
jgi:hypothetical protein